MIKMNLIAAILLCSAILAIDFVGLSNGTCSSEFTDASSCTILSDIVFEGQPVSPASQTTPHNVTFQVKKLHKGSLGQNDKKQFHPISVGIFGEKENSSECISGPVKPKTKYLVFLKDIDVTSANVEFYRITCSSPVLANKKNSKEARASACATCGKKPTLKLSPAKEVKVAVGNNTQVSCNYQGNPPPKITWTKDGNPLIYNSRIQLKSAKRSSKLIIKKFSVDDQGFYECQAVNVIGSSPKIGVRLTPIIATTTPSTSHKTLCPDQRLCFNNGTCYELIQLGRKFCSCADGFRGNRCQEKKAPESRMVTAMTPNFLFVVVVGASVAGAVLLVASLVAVCSFLRKHRKVRKLVRDPNLIAMHQFQTDPAAETAASLRHAGRKDGSMQTECSQSANVASPGGKRLPGSGPLPNGKLSVSEARSAHVAHKGTGSPHVSSSSSGSSPSEADFAEYYVERQSNVGSSRGATPQSKPKTTREVNKKQLNEATELTPWVQKTTEV